MKTEALSLTLTCIISAYAGVASANSVTSVSTVSGSVVFIAPADRFSGTISSVPYLSAGTIKDGTKVATVSIKVDGGSSAILAYRFSPGAGSLVKPGGSGEYQSMTFRGMTDNNKITLAAGRGSGVDVKVGSGAWVVSGAFNMPMSVDTIDLAIVTDGDQKVGADTYLISVDIGEYLP
ncbi:TPA: hypothetical protein ACW2OH_004716 [Salmonella enterica]|nr:hypothetical protein [Salmonella enterica]ECI8012176.1 hypothetical protein [Salmonella enterica subsp. enterica]HEC8152636.1 hypothetical protein [Salmonella enterica subsp. enterica serovar Mississippi]EBM7135607.1 hypothetical protein [Salmonella enterica]EJU7422307.1 hypothetical protein [Salmonella enterica]